MEAGRTRVGIGPTASRLGRSSVVIVTALVLALASVLESAAAPGGPPAAQTGASARVAGPCPATRAIGAIRPGMVGIGWTTIRGDRPEPFRVQVLGMLRDGIGPGRDLVVVKVSDLTGRRVVRAGGGIWSGMSGSPVYIRGRLAGAISYSLADGPSHIGGMTPARYMERLATEPVRGSVAAGTVGAASATRGRSQVRLAGRLGRRVASVVGRSAGRTIALRRLAVPIAASAGVGGRRSFVTRELRRRFGSVRLVSGAAGAASTTRGLVASPRAGQNMAGVVAQGDVSLAAVGTVTAVCRGRVIGFGHAMTGEGAVAFGAARATTVTIVGGTDPYKLANVGRLFGLLDADLFTGVRAVAGRRPRLLPISARIRSRTTGRTRTGRTQVTMPAWMPSVAADHLLYDMMAVDQRTGGGTAVLTWTIRGTRLDTDAAWTLRRTDVVTDTGDVAFASALQLFTLLDLLVTDPGTQARIASVDIAATTSRATTIDRVRRIEVSRNGGAWTRSGRMEVAGGDRLRVRVSVRPRTGRTTSSLVEMVVPDGARGDGTIRVMGGGDAAINGCDPMWSTCPDTFGQLLDGLRSAPRADDLLLALEFEAADGTPLRVMRTTRLAHVVTGDRTLALTAH